jgi:hypothetical protein
MMELLAVREVVYVALIVRQSYIDIFSTYVKEGIPSEAVNAMVKSYIFHIFRSDYLLNYAPKMRVMGGHRPCGARGRAPHTIAVNIQIQK